ncbi:hypothetical protein ACFYZ9_17490, partial [Streptomyces sp. NPDC001691]|uniref:hypothetical protein n=1 Tax=Streptomyces sp. NPDC001691 TaxID=3364600 RepID=UPI003696F4FF
WVLAAEAEGVWQEGWVSPATVFWPDSDQVAWDHDVVAGVRLRSANALPKDDDALRRRVRECVRDSWFVHVVVHEAMTPGVAGRRPVSVFLPSGLRHRVVEHRATPEQAQIADFALKRELGVRLPRGGAVVLPSVGVEGDPGRFVVRSVFLDGSEPVELVERVREFARLPRGLGEEASVALGRLRRGWHLLTEQEELVHARAMVERYAQALEAMTDSRDRYREAAEAAHAALAEAGGGEGAPLLGGPKPLRTEASPLGALTKALGRLRPPNK